jgi:nucleoside-diphosphate-sugar epimerase
VGKTKVVTDDIVVTGFGGLHLTDRLLADRHTVVGIDSFRPERSLG